MAIRICIIAIVLVRDIQLGVVSTDQQVCNPGEEGVMVCQSHGHITKLRIRRARKLERGEDHLTKMIELIGVMISPPQKIKDLDTRIDTINTNVILEVEDPSDKVVIMVMMEGLHPGPLFDSLSKCVPETLSTLQSKANKYITTEELAEVKPRRRRINERCPQTLTDRMIPPLNALVAQVLMEIKNEDFVKWPGKIKTNPLRRNKNKYYEFHKDNGHNTNDCF
ncbi:hypothetical protein Acr_20g0007440 [Actinidia rufa]|uniref:Uncharacterized protein n=1 Tax=Actinidia rufa TaxID=165716 RepID=A0A7J0GDM9_9ERIC|nr:hypothetical protein Acr_20g0007440 [Actinidia rufa]